MTIDDELLKKAKTAESSLSAAERQLMLARADYHTAIRRMHLGGGSLREIAQALALSHQRVQQIVSDAGGTWWQRIWRTREPKRDAVCSFCGLPPGEVAKLIAGPNVYICGTCVERAERPRPAQRGEPGRAACSFCGKRRAAQRSLYSVDAAAVCSECLTLCRQILDDRTI